MKAIGMKMGQAPSCIATTVAAVVLTCQPSLAETLVLSCSGKVFVPEITWEKHPTGGVITIDFDRGSVEGLDGTVSGKIVNITDLKIDFETVMLSNRPDRAWVFRYAALIASLASYGNRMRETSLMSR